jgi:aspartyl-tRNA(Asn)/glutamyl-tRNA(Gln) amidotransferase subunit A
MNLISKADARDFMSLPFDEVDYLAEARKDINLKNLRIGFVPDMKVGLPVHPEVRAAAEAAAKALESAGAHVELMAPFLTAELADGMCRFFEARSFHDYSQMPPATQAKVLPFIAEWSTWRAKNFSGRDVFAAYQAYVTMRDVTVRACQPYDYVLSPTSPILPYEAELPSPNNDPHNALPHIAFTVPYNMSEQPAASLNWTFSKDGLQGGDGPLPVGIQIAGRRFDDAGVLRMARTLEQMRPKQRPWPKL